MKLRNISYKNKQQINKNKNFTYNLFCCPLEYINTLMR